MAPISLPELCVFSDTRVFDKKGILSLENTKNWEREYYGITLCIANVDIKVLEKNISGILTICILISL